MACKLISYFVLFFHRPTVALVSCAALFGDYSWKFIFDMAVSPYRNFIIILSCIFSDLCGSS